jgi:hypothetical protein
MGIREACRCSGNGMWQSQSERVLCRFQETSVQPVLLCGEECYRTDVPENVTELVNATTRRRGVHFPTRWCPTTVAYGCPGVPQWIPTRSMDWSCISHRQHLLHMATLVTGPDSVWFLPLGFCQGQRLHPPLPKTLPELQRRISNAIENVTEDMLERVWQEWEYRLDICHFTRGTHIECI